MREYGDIIYEKEFTLKHQGPWNMIIHSYGYRDWFNDGHLNRIVHGLFKEPFLSEPCEALVFNCSNHKKTVVCKEKIRKFYGEEGRWVHINDFHWETISLAQVVFNDNSIHVLNYAQPQDFEQFEKLFSFYTKWLSKRTDKEFFCINNSSVLAVYGIRDVHDLDFLHKASLSRLFMGPEDLVASHNETLNLICKQYNIDLRRDDIIFNPSHHFYYKDIKFASLDVVTLIKERRRREKDVRDLKLIREYMELYEDDR